MESKASVRWVRIAPRKLRTVVDLVRGKDLSAALGILGSNKKVHISRVLTKLLNAGVANAKENMNLDIDRLYVKKIVVDGGPSLKRYLPRMRGRADQILKRTSQITVVLDERAGRTAAKAKAAPAGTKAAAKKAAKGAGRGAAAASGTGAAKKTTTDQTTKKAGA